jgi:hypothetical protein
MEGIGRYNLGYSARETVRYPKGRFGIAIPEKTFRLWYMVHKPICTQTESSFCLYQCGCKSTGSDQGHLAHLHSLTLTHSEPLFVRCAALVACRAEIGLPGATEQKVALSRPVYWTVKL